MSKNYNSITINGRSTPSSSNAGGNSYSGSSRRGGESHTDRGQNYNSGGSDNQNSASSATYTGNGNSQGLGKQYAPAEVLGSPGNTSKNVYGDSGPIHDIIAFCRKKSGDCWGSNALHHGPGGVDGPLYVKAINLGRTDMHDKDAGNLFYVLRDFNFNLDIINLSNNKLGNVVVESMIYGITCANYQTLYNPSNWQPISEYDKNSTKRCKHQPE